LHRSILNDLNVGKVPSSTDSVVDCTSSSNLNLTLPVGKHDFKVEIRSSSGSCQMDTSGTINVIKDECIPIYIDITKLK